MKFRIREEYCTLYEQNIFYAEVRGDGTIMGWLFPAWAPVHNWEYGSPLTFCRSKESALQAIEAYKLRQCKRKEEDEKKKSSSKVHYL